MPQTCRAICTVHKNGVSTEASRYVRQQASSTPRSKGALCAASQSTPCSHGSSRGQAWSNSGEAATSFQHKPWICVNTNSGSGGRIRNASSATIRPSSIRASPRAHALSRAWLAVSKSSASMRVTKPPAAKPDTTLAGLLAQYHGEGQFLVVARQQFEQVVFDPSPDGLRLTVVGHLDRQDVVRRGPATGHRFALAHHAGGADSGPVVVEHQRDA